MRRPLALLIGLGLLLAATGCGGASVNRAQFERLKLGMRASDVERILGKGKAIDASEVDRLVNEPADPPAGGRAPAPLKVDTSEMRGLRWGGDKKNITVIFQNDKVYRLFQTGL